jgi:AcrR family transcriptional regulator
MKHTGNEPDAGGARGPARGRESTIRGRFRDFVRDEVKTLALRQLAEGGPQALSINAIAKELGVSGPALYRYFAGRDELLTELIIDAYRDLTTALAEATAPSLGLGPRERGWALAVAFRDWARGEPHRYRLLFSAPLPGYDAHAGPLVVASQQAMLVVLDVLTDLLPPESAPTLPKELEAQLDQWAALRHLDGVPPALALKGLTIWSRLHGLVDLEIEGNFASMGLDPDLLFEVEVNDVLFDVSPGAV